MGMSTHEDIEEGRSSNVSLPRLAAWVEGSAGVDASEARRIVTTAYHRYGYAIAKAWKRGCLALDLAPAKDGFQIELSVTD
jgi:hypothetical protein